MSAGGIASDVNGENDLSAPEEMTNGMEPGQEQNPATGLGGAAAQAPTTPPPTV